MKKSKITIRKKIFFSYIVVAIVSTFLIFIAFNLCLKVYVKNDTKKQLVKAAKAIEKVIIDDDSEYGIKHKFQNIYDVNKYILKIDKFLENEEYEFNINCIILNSNKELIYPQKYDNEKYEIIKKSLVSVVEKKKLINSKKVQNGEFYFNVFRERYEAIIYPLKIPNETNIIYLIVYSDLIKAKGFIKIVNTILLIILGITIIFSLLVSNNLSKKISYPISELSKYAKKIGERQYDYELTNYDKRDEIGELAEDIKIMSEKLYNYNNNMKIFIQNASHEMRTPLMSIQGYAEGIKYGVVDDTSKAIDIIIEESKRLSLLVDELLYLSKIEAMNDKFNIEELNLENIIHNSIEKVNGIAVQNGKKINFLSDDTSIIFLGDKEKMTRAILNVLANCLRYCKENVEVTLKKENEKVTIVIEDDGEGFDETELDNIFDRFFKGKGGIYGIGLTITKSIIEKHRGTIIAENKINGGARFKVTLNLKWRVE